MAPNKKFKTSVQPKLNLTLEIRGVDGEGYHKVSSVMQTIYAKTLSFPIVLEKVQTGQESIRGHDKLELILRRAIGELSKEACVELPCSITASDSVPLGTGMGIDSSHAASVLRLANVAFELGMDKKRLLRVASRVGNDVQFFIFGGRARVEGGKAHSVTPMQMPPTYFVIAKPEEASLSTPVQYKLHDQTGKSLQQLACEACPMTKYLMDIIVGGEEHHGVTGKGPTVFWEYRSSDAAAFIESEIRQIRGVAVHRGESFPLEEIQTSTGIVLEP